MKILTHDNDFDPKACRFESKRFRITRWPDKALTFNTPGKRHGFAIAAHIGLWSVFLDLVGSKDRQ